MSNTSQDKRFVAVGVMQKYDCLNLYELAQYCHGANLFAATALNLSGAVQFSVCGQGIYLFVLKRNTCSSYIYTDHPR